MKWKGTEGLCGSRRLLINALFNSLYALSLVCDLHLSLFIYKGVIKNCFCFCFHPRYTLSSQFFKRLVTFHDMYALPVEAREIMVELYLVLNR